MEEKKENSSEQALGTKNLMQGPRRHLGCEAEPDGLGSSSTPGGRRHPQAPTMPGPGPSGSFQPHPRGAHLMTAGRAGCCAGASRNLSPSPRPYPPYNPPRPQPACLGSVRPGPVRRRLAPRSPRSSCRRSATGAGLPATSCGARSGERCAHPAERLV